MGPRPEGTSRLIYFSHSKEGLTVATHFNPCRRAPGLTPGAGSAWTPAVSFIAAAAGCGAATAVVEAVAMAGEAVATEEEVAEVAEVMEVADARRRLLTTDCLAK